MKKLNSLAVCAITASSIAVACLGTSAVQAGTAQPTEVSARESVNHSTIGTRIEFYNRAMTSDEKMYIGGQPLKGSDAVVLKGRNGDGDDVQAHFRTSRGDGPNIYAHNPALSSAYVQIGDHKVYRQEFVEKNGMYFGVRFLGTDAGDKQWRVDCYGSTYPWAHKFIHRTNEHDGIKGQLTNNMSKPITVIYSNRETYTIKRGERFLFFDANPDVSGGYGLQVELRANGKSYYVELADPTTGYPTALIRSQQGERKETFWREFGRDFTDKNYRGHFFVTRWDDQTAWPGDTSHTTDWGVFDLQVAMW